MLRAIKTNLYQLWRMEASVHAKCHGQRPSKAVQEFAPLEVAVAIKALSIPRQHMDCTPPHHKPFEKTLRAIVAFEHTGAAGASFKLPFLPVVVPHCVPR